MDEISKRHVTQSDAWVVIRARIDRELRIHVDNLMKKDRDLASTQFTRGYIKALADLVNHYERPAKRGGTHE